MRTIIWKNGQKIIRDMTAEEIAEMQPSDDDLAAQARNRRDGLLAASDWTQVSDAPVDKSAWATYRQALRDIPQQSGFPASVDWPVKP